MVDPMVARYMTPEDLDFLKEVEMNLWTKPGQDPIEFQYRDDEPSNEFELFALVEEGYVEVAEGGLLRLTDWGRVRVRDWRSWGCR